MKKIREFPVPTNEKELDQFLYTTLYLKRYIPGRADHARKMKEAVQWKETKPKTGKLIREKVGWLWTQECQESFDYVKKCIIDNACIGGDPLVQYHLMCDASKTGIGAVLFQMPTEEPGTVMKGKQDVRVVMFISQRLSDVEQRYLNTEREALAVLRGLEECRWLIVGSPFPVMVYTDHSALLTVLKGEGTKGAGAGHHKGRITSWMLRLSEYDVEYHHVKGSENKLADGLSRMNLESMDVPRIASSDWEDVALIEETEGETSIEEEFHIREVEKQWEKWIQDQWYGDVVRYKLRGTTVGLSDKDAWYVKRISSRYVLVDGQDQDLLYREMTGELAKCIFATRVNRVLQRYHDFHGHFAKDMTLRLLKGKYYWPSRSESVVQYIRSCDACQRFGPLRPVKRELKTILNLQPMDMLGIDFVGPINPVSRNGGKKYILIAVDYFSRFLFAMATEKADGVTVRDFVARKIAQTFGWPVSIYCDNASYFVKGVFPEELRKRGVLQFSAPLTHPSSVGLAEKYVHLTMTALRTLLRGPPDGNGMSLDWWDECLASAVFAINNRIVRTHGYSPAQLLLGYTPKGHPEDFTFRDGIMTREGVMEAYMLQWREDREVEKWEELGNERERTEREKESGESEMISRDRGVHVWAHLSLLEERRLEAVENTIEEERRRERDFKKDRQGARQSPGKGDLVLLRRFAVDKDKGKKLEPKWEGPYLVQRLARSKVSALLDDIHTGKHKGRYSLDSLKVYVLRADAKQDDHGTINISDLRTEFDSRVLALCEVGRI